MSHYLPPHALLQAQTSSRGCVSACEGRIREVVAKLWWRRLAAIDAVGSRTRGRPGSAWLLATMLTVDSVTDESKMPITGYRGGRRVQRAGRARGGSDHVVPTNCAGATSSFRRHAGGREWILRSWRYGRRHPALRWCLRRLRRSAPAALRGEIWESSEVPILDCTGKEVRDQLSSALSWTTRCDAGTG